MSREVIAGNKINLRARFRDDLQEAALASGVSVHVFDPDATHPLDVAAAYLNVYDPTYLGEGIYQYEFYVPDDADEGTWHDLWYGTLNTQLLSGEFSFEVYAAGEAVELGEQLGINNIIEVTLSSGIRGADGTYLSDGYSFEFMTTTSPTYTTIRKVKLEAGGFLSDLPDLTIQLSILEASLEADQLNFTSSRNESFFQHARREWVTCKTAVGLIDNITSHAIKAKRLGDLEVEYDSGAVLKTISRMMECLGKWEPQLIAGGYALDSQQPVYAVKGYYDPDRPNIGRLWSDMDNSLSDRVPGANTKDVESTSRRYKNVFKSKKRFW